MTSHRIKDYGEFDSASGAFILRNDPPRKWNNLHISGPGPFELYSEFSNIGDGAMTIRDDSGTTCQLVGYDKKYLFIRDDTSLLAFSPWGCPGSARPAFRECRYHPHMTQIFSACDGLRVHQRAFVPLGGMFEAWTVEIHNETNRHRPVSAFAYAQFELTGRLATGKNVPKDNESRILPDLGGVFVTNSHRLAKSDESSALFNGYLIALNGFTSATGYRDSFTKEDFSLATPRLLDEQTLDNFGYVGPDCAAAVHCAADLEPGGTLRFDFLLGWAPDEAALRAQLAKITPAWIDGEETRHREFYLTRNSKIRISTGHPDQDALINHFSAKTMMGYLVNKSGFRDNLQTDMALAMYDYPVAKANLLRALASQEASGAVPHGFRPLNPLPYADKPGWIMQVIPAVIQESGDFALLDEVVPYRDGGEGTVLDHMLRAMRYMASDTGANGLCDQHFADWNDGLEPSEETGARESVMVTQQLALGAWETARLAEHLGEPALAREAEKIFQTFHDRLNTVAWDGEWYQRTICESGYRIGTAANDEARIFLETQAFAILSHTAPPDRARSVMQAIDRHLEKPGGFAIVDPPFTRFDGRIGRFSAIRPFTRTNGGFYCHAAGFKAVADCMMGRAGAAWRTFRKVAPDSPENPTGHSMGEPFSFTNCYEALPQRHLYGRAYYPWRTGTVNWFTMLLVEWILGARRSYDGLLIDPCLTREIPRATLQRHFRGAVYQIEIDNTAGRETGTREIVVDGKQLEGTLIPPAPAGSTVRVSVII